MMKHRNTGMRTALAVAISSLVVAGCNSDGSSGGDSAASTTINSKIVKIHGGAGGNGAGNSGGDGDYFELYKEGGAGDVKLLKGGSANAGFATKSFTPNFGSNPAVITANTVVTELADCSASPLAGSLYQVDGSSNLYKSDGTGAGCETAERVTGVDIKAGVTVTLPLVSGDWAYVTLAADMRNNGRITTADVNAGQRGHIDLEPSSYIGTGTIETHGTQAGQNGGDLYVYTDYGFINSGAFNASGADSTTGNGGHAGYIYLEGPYYTQNKGKLTARGGNTTFAGASGGDADYVELYANWGPVYNSGEIDARGGEGATGGDGGDVYMYAYLGNLFNSGNMMAYGANSTVGNGGNGGEIYFYSAGGDIRNSGHSLAWGGNTTAASGSGGNGEYVYAYADYGSLYEYTPAGNIHWSGAIDLHGGNAVATGTGNGGDAGYVYAEVYGSDVNAKSEIAFLGYTTVEAYGGDGNHGGSGDGIGLYNYDSEVDGYTDVTAIAGNVINQASLVGRGGNARAAGADAQGNGGRGGYIYLETDYYATAQLNPKGQKTTHTGDVDISGGNGRNQDSQWINYSGYSWFWGYNGSSFSGTFTSNGGNDIGTGGGNVSFGGYANEFYAYSELGEARVTGTVNVNGGNANYRGGDSAGAEVYGNRVNTTATYNANGGNANVAKAGSQGGYGGYIELKATRPEASSAASADATYAGGTGITAGSEGGFMRLISCTGQGC